MLALQIGDVKKEVITVFDMVVCGDIDDGGNSGGGGNGGGGDVN